MKCQPNLLGHGSASKLLDGVSDGKPKFQSRRLTKVVGIVHTGIHTLSSLGRVRVTSIASDEDALVNGKF